MDMFHACPTNHEMCENQFVVNGSVMPYHAKAAQVTFVHSTDLSSFDSDLTVHFLLIQTAVSLKMIA